MTTPVEGTRPAHGETADLVDYDRASRALSLRIAGMRWAEVADKVGYSTGHEARVAGVRLLQRHELEAVDEYRSIQSARYDAVLRGLWPGVLRGDPAAASVAVKVLDSQARMLGLDRPQQVNVAVGVDPQFDAMIARAQQALGQGGDGAPDPDPPTLEPMASVLARAAVGEVDEGEEFPGTDTPPVSRLRPRKVNVKALVAQRKPRDPKTGKFLRTTTDDEGQAS